MFRILIFALLSFAMMNAGGFAHAQAQAVPATCDQGFYDVMNARAWMESKREMEAAQKFILKPDSVLEYSCFKDRVQELSEATAIGEFFANSSSGVSRTVYAAVNDYLDNNFSHGYGGGLSQNSPGGTCEAMYAIWNFLKCQNFDKADFQAFQDMSGNDRRALPASCPDNGRTAKWTAQIKASSPPPSSVPTYLNLLDSTACSRFAPVPTGIKIIDGGGAAYDDAVCVAPGCYYDKSERCR